MFGILPIVLGVTSIAFYVRGILLGKVKPHAFSWLVWSLITGIAFAAQLLEGGGAGSWFLGFAALANLSIFILSLFKGEKTIKFFDWVSLIAALLALLPWWLTKNPLMSVLLITFIDACGYVPTFRKGYEKPFEESPVMFALGTVQFALSIAALQTFSITTWFFPLVCGVMNALVAGMLFVRRRALKR